MRRGRKLSTEEYLKESEKWFENNGKYYEELVSINRKEKDIISTKFNGNDELYLKSDDAILLDKERKELKEKYKGFVSVYTDPDFYCLLTTDNIDKLIVSHEGDNNDVRDTKKHFIRELNKYSGKMMTDGYRHIGIFEGIAVCLNDFYYILRDPKDKSTYWCTCVVSIYPYKKEEKSYTIVTNGRDYL